MNPAGVDFYARVVTMYYLTLSCKRNPMEVCYTHRGKAVIENVAERLSRQRLKLVIICSKS